MLDLYYHLKTESTQLKQLKCLTKEGKHQEALKQLIQLSSEKRSKKESIEILFLLVENYIAIGDFPEAILNLNEINLQELEEKFSKLNEYSYHINQAKTLLYTGQFNQAEASWNYAWKIKEYLENKNNKEEIIVQQMEAELYLIKGKIAHFKGNVDNALQNFNLALEICENIDFKLLQFHILNTKAMTNLEKGNLSESLELLKEAFKLVELVKNQYFAIRIIGNMGLVYFEMGLIDEAIEHHKGAQHIAEEINDLSGIGYNQHNIGRCYVFKGELNLALEYLFSSSESLRKLEHKDPYAITLLNIGDIYYSRGQLLEADEYFQEILTLDNEINKRTIGVAMGSLGLISYEQNDSKKAQKYLQDGLLILKERDLLKYIPEALFQIIRIAIEDDQMDIAKKYLEELESYKEKTSVVQVNQLCLLAKGLILSHSPRIRDRGEAEEIFKEIIQCTKCHHNYTVLALFNLSKLLFAEYQSTRYNEILIELEQLIQKLEEIAGEKNNHKLLIESYLLKTQLLLFYNRIKEAERLLYQAEKIAKEQEIHRLVKIISAKHDDLLTELSKIEENKKELSEEELKRYALTHLDEILNSLAQQKSLDIPDLTPDKPVRFFIMDKNSGVTLYSKNFSDNFSIENQQLLSGLLTALKDFSNEIFNDVLEKVKIGNYSIIFNSQSIIAFCYVFEGSSYYANQKLEAFMNYIKKTPNLLKNLEESVKTGYVFSGKTFEQIDSYIQDFFF